MRIMDTFNRVMIIDDNDIDNLIHSRLVTELKFGKIVDNFNNGKAAILYLKDQLRKQKENLPDIIFVDLHMPIMDGWAFIQEFEKLKIYKDIPVYVLSSAIYDQEISKLKGHRTYVGFVPKPLSVDALEEISQRHLNVAL